MKPLEEMTDQELSAALDNMRIAETYGNEVDQGDWNGVLNEIQTRLSTHPAQRIADATGFTVTVDGDGTVCMWVNTDWRVLEPYEGTEEWLGGNDFDAIEIDATDWPDDNKPWQESIYRPRKDGKNDSITSD